MTAYIAVAMILGPVASVIIVARHFYAKRTLHLSIQAPRVSSIEWMKIHSEMKEIGEQALKRGDFETAVEASNMSAICLANADKLAGEG